MSAEDFKKLPIKIPVGGGAGNVRSMPQRRRVCSGPATAFLDAGYLSSAGFNPTTSLTADIAQNGPGCHGNGYPGNIVKNANRNWWRS
jgi:hypothetical protein